MCEKSKEKRASGDDNLSAGDPNSSDSAPQVSTDWRLFRAKLVEKEASPIMTVPNMEKVTLENAKDRGDGSGLWAHRVSHVEPGCLLVARPESFAGDSDAYFAEAVIFIMNHGEHGSLGLVLNKRMALSLASVPSDTSSPLGEAFHLAKAEIFSNSFLYNGGPMGLDGLMVLHNKKGIPDALEIIDGVYSGGLLGAMTAIRSGEMVVSRLRFFAGYSGWMPGQLEQEIADGTWFVAASSPEYVTGYQDIGKGHLPMWNALFNQLNAAPDD
jgi:putative transcriptional regulator